MGGPHGHPPSRPGRRPHPTELAEGKHHGAVGESRVAARLDRLDARQYVFRGDEPRTAYLRPSNIDAARHSRAVLKLLVRKLRSAWPAVKLTLRGDSGFCRWRLMRWCDSHGIGSVLGLARHPALQRAARDEIERAGRHFRRAGSVRRVVFHLSSSYP